jgi:hypothetical protein
MAQEGDYPFVVNVWNRFALDSGDNINILNVTFNYHPHGDGGEDLKSKDYTLEPGEFLAFPLYWSDEYLEIKPGESISTQSEYHTIWAGMKAGCEFDGEAETFILAAGEAKNANGMVIPGRYIGGAWRVENLKKDWALKIFKLVHDPEEENVTVGEDPPTEP